MFDCVYPTRTARFGVALVPSGTMRLKHSKFEHDTRPIQEDCKCQTCQNYSRAFVRSLLMSGNPTGAQIMTIHNVAYMMQHVRDMRSAIIKNQFPEFVNNFLDQQFQNKKIPEWVVASLAKAGIDVN